MSDKHKSPEILAPDGDGIAAAAAILAAHGLIAVPTETVYGLAARADSADAVAAIFRTKGRPDFNPLIVHVRSRADARALAIWDDRAEALATAFWPGPLTIVLPRLPDAPVAMAVTAGLPTIALRCPAHPAMQALLVAAGTPLAAPSANRSGAVSPTCAAHVIASLGALAPPILDGGPCQTGLESTIVALRADGGWQILRPGPITEAQISGILGTPPAVTPSSGVEAPGQLASHYAPGKPVRLGALSAAPDEFHIGFGAISGQFNLSPAGDPAEAAARLYEALHCAAADPCRAICVAPIPAEGIGAAINDRLARAAA